MKSISKLISIIILLSLFTISCTITALALPSDITTTSRDTGFSVSIPTSLPIFVDGSGNVSVANNAVITNNRDSSIAV